MNTNPATLSFIAYLQFRPLVQVCGFLFAGKVKLILDFLEKVVYYGMKKLKQVMEDDGTGFVFWCIFLVITFLEFTNVKLIAEWFYEAYTFGLTIDWILLLVISISLPMGFVSLTYNVWFKEQ